MPLHLRRRGEIWHARGTVRVGRKVIEVPEFSTGSRGRADAEAVAAAEEARVRNDELDGDAGRARRLTLADCFLAYLHRPGGVHDYDKARVADFNARIGHRPIAEAEAAWQEWLRTRGAEMAPATAARWRAILQAALNEGARAHRLPTLRLPPVKQRQAEAAAYLTVAEQDRLLAGYSTAARSVATVLCFAGLRTQEALRLDWRHVDMARSVLMIPGFTAGGGARTKTGQGRSVPMHPRVLEELQRLRAERGNPDTGTVFLSARGAPYADTRGKGGNPLAKAHRTACRRAGISNFRVHDWRHHWASRMVMAGCDLYTLMRLGGWTTPRMVQRYAAVSGEHMAEAIARLA